MPVILTQHARKTKRGVPMIEMLVFGLNATILTAWVPGYLGIPCSAPPGKLTHPYSCTIQSF